MGGIESDEKIASVKKEVKLHQKHMHRKVQPVRYGV